MSSKPIVGLLTLMDTLPGGESRVVTQEGNLSFKQTARRRTIHTWDNNVAQAAFTLSQYPWKNSYLLADDDITVGHGGGDANIYPAAVIGITTQAGSDPAKMRFTGTVATVPASATPRVFGCVTAVDTQTGSTNFLLRGNQLASQVDVPLDYTQMTPNPWFHPAYQTNSLIATAVGVSYVTYTGGQFWDVSNRMRPSGYWMIRIESGADAGYYFINHIDFTNNRMYLRCLNGTPFAALATASGLSATACPGRHAYFNETGVIPLSIGSAAVAGRFNPRKTDPYLRESFILKATFEKTGSTEFDVATEQQGSYYLSLKPYIFGDGIPGTAQEETGLDGYGCWQADGTNTIPWFNFFGGGVNGMALDWENQRLWFGYTDLNNNSGIAHWRYKTTEGMREVANYLGTAAQATFVSPSIVLAAGDIITNVEVGSPAGSTKNWVYITIFHASGSNAGVVIIKPDLTTLQYRLADGLPLSTVSASVVDKTRARVGTAGDAVSNVGTANLDSASAAFTAADVGRAIKVTGGTADNGTYLIGSITSGTSVVVTTLAGAAVSFAGGTGGTFEIGDRLYLFFSTGAAGAGKINYMESMAPGTFLTRTVTMTNGSIVQARIAGGTALRYGQKCLCSIDRANGNVYWISTDTNVQINKYDVTANSHALILASNATLLAPTGGPANPGTPALWTAIHVNSKFDHIWVGSDAGHFRLLKSTFAAADAKRYFGGDNTTYYNPAGVLRPSGWYGAGSIGTSFIRSYIEMPDGRMFTMLGPVNLPYIGKATYSQESDTWSFHNEIYSGSGTEFHHMLADPYGRVISMMPSGNNYPWVLLTSDYVDYQWDGTNWFPKEVVRSGLPNKSAADTTSCPGCLAKPIHSTADDVLFGMKLQFNRSTGGSPPPNNQYLGRGGQTRVTATDGATTTASAAFGGSGFVAGDVGNLLRIESGGDAGVYKITAYVNAAQVTLTNLNGTAFSAANTAGTLTYTVWSLGTPGSNAGPEDVTVLLADGFSKDNTQDITGMTYEVFYWKTVLHQNDEARKFCVETPLAVPGSLATKFYFETYPRVAPAPGQYDPATSHHLALPGAETTNGRQALDWMMDKYLQGTVGRANLYSSPSDALWYGINAQSSVLGYSVMVDFGKDVEVGFVQIRLHTNGTVPGLLYTTIYNGIIGNIYKANSAGGAPVASSGGVARTTGTTNLSLTANNSTISLGSGDFMGTRTLTPAVANSGVIVAGQNIFTDTTNAPFVASDVGKSLRLITNGDVGYYRIVSLTSSSAIVIRNLDQTAKAWSTSASSIDYGIWDAVREEDQIYIPVQTGITAIHRLCIERLLSTTTAQVRTPPSVTYSGGGGASWSCYAPTWTPVKRLSTSTEAVPPEVKNNGTWMSADGREQYSNTDAKLYFDLTTSDLSASARTGRWWKFSALPRFNTNGIGAEHWLSTVEFYDTSGNKLAVSKYNSTDEARTNADFYFNHISRFDFIQAADDAVTGAFNGVAALGGAGGDTITLSGGNKFLGFQVRPLLADISTTVGTNQLNSASAGFTTADVGRFVHVTTGADAGYYRITASNSGSQVTVSSPAGNPVTFAGSSAQSATFHEGINFGGVYPDKFVFLSDFREFSILSINDTLTTIVISENNQPARAAATWEIRRPGYDTASITTEPTKTARMVRPMSTFPVQSGDMCHDSRGHFRFFQEDIGAGYQRADGVIAGGSGAFTGTGFCADDVGRLLYITTGVNIGIYEISVFTSSTAITVKNHYTGAAVSLTADAGPVTYQVWGDRRFRISKVVVGLRA